MRNGESHARKPATHARKGEDHAGKPATRAGIRKNYEVVPIIRVTATLPTY